MATREKTQGYGFGCIAVAFAPAVIGFLAYVWIVPLFFWGWNFGRGVEAIGMKARIWLAASPSGQGAPTADSPPVISVTPRDAPAQISNSAAPDPAATKRGTTGPNSGD